jgi:hypothetical protein
VTVIKRPSKDELQKLRRSVLELKTETGCNGRVYHWCDPQREKLTPLAIEMYNSVSNLPGIVLSLIGLVNTIHQRFERRFFILHFTSVVVGIGSTIMHCTLVYK